MVLAAHLVERAVKVSDPATDSLRLYPVCTWCERRLTLIGQGRRSSDPDVIVL